MELKIIHSGGALATPDGAQRLKDLVGCDELGAGARRIVRAALQDARWARITLDDGSEHAVAWPRRAEGGTDAGADLLVRGARQVLTMNDGSVGLVEHASVACREGRVLAVVDAADDVSLAPGAVVIDAGDAVVTPGLVDPHMHPVFGGERSREFAMKAEGRSYLEIHHAGGGIFSTVEATRAASTAALEARCAENLSRALAWGVTTCEGKSGYALDVEGELRLLEVLRTVGDCHPVDVEATLLGAHAVPRELQDRRSAYVAAVAQEMVPRAAEAQLARFCDAYCEEGAFTVDEVRGIFSAARRAGLGLRLHAEQFSHQGGAELAGELRAASADHLEQISDAGIAAMAAGGTVAVLLPGAALACRCPWPPTARIVAAGVPVALGTDLNPGSSMTAALPLMMSLACMQMGLSCELAWRAVTVNAARSLGREDIGVIAPGARADLVLFDVPDYRYVPYHYGENHARHVIKHGRIVHTRS